MTRPGSAASTPAVGAVEAAGVPFTLHRYRHRPGAESYGLEAAAALRVPPARVFKTLMTVVDRQLTVAVVPVGSKLDLKALAAAAGGKRAALADHRVTERSSGYVLGGISPLGQRTPVPTVLDGSVLDFDTIYVSGGRRGLELELAGADLVRLTGGSVAAISRDGSR